MKTTGLMTAGLFAVSLAFAPAFSYASPPNTFRAAKRIAAKIHAGRPTIYCGCRWYRRGRHLAIDQASCGYRTRKNARRANRIEWEHVMPAWEMGHQRQCWQHGGRKNCRKNDPVFRRMEADLFNLRPSVGEANADRSNYRYGMIPGEARRYGACDFEVAHRVAEPRPAVRGNVTRIYAYMARHYGLRISRKQRRLFAAWDRADPVDADECVTNRKIAAVMGRKNPFVARACRAAGL